MWRSLNFHVCLLTSAIVYKRLCIFQNDGVQNAFYSTNVDGICWNKTYLTFGLLLADFRWLHTSGPVLHRASSVRSEWPQATALAVIFVSRMFYTAGVDNSSICFVRLLLSIRRHRRWWHRNLWCYSSCTTRWPSGTRADRRRWRPSTSRISRRQLDYRTFPWECHRWR